MMGLRMGRRSTSRHRSELTVQQAVKRASCWSWSNAASFSEVILPGDQPLDPVSATDFEPALHGAPAVVVVGNVFDPDHQHGRNQTHIDHDPDAVLIAA